MIVFVLVDWAVHLSPLRVAVAGTPADGAPLTRQVMHAVSVRLQLQFWERLTCDKNQAPRGGLRSLLGHSWQWHSLVAV